MSRKPKDPRHHGLEEPQKVISKEGAVFLADLTKGTHTDGEVSLQTIINAWHKVAKEVEGEGFRITKGPYFAEGSYYGRSISLAYTYEWDNPRYDEEMASYSAAVNEYTERLRRFNETEERRKNSPPNVDEQIIRSERRLANLKAIKVGEPIPFPEG